MLSNGDRFAVRGLTVGLIGVSLLLWTESAAAQVRSTTGGLSRSGTGSISGSFSGSSFSGGSFSGGSLSGSSSGSFSGGSFSGGSFSGGAFSGGSMSGSFSGGSFSGTTSGTGRLGIGGYGNTGTTYQGVSQTNPFASSYANPLAAGLSNGTGNTRFGMPLFNVTTGTSGSFTGNVGGISGGISGQSAATFNAASGAHRTTPFVAGVELPSFQPPPRPEVSRTQLEVQGVLARSSALPSKGNIRVAVEGATVVLRGTVADNRERLLSEAMIRLTPGVADVRNELRVRSSLPAPIVPP